MFSWVEFHAVSILIVTSNGLGHHHRINSLKQEGFWQFAYRQRRFGVEPSVNTMKGLVTRASKAVHCTAVLHSGMLICS